MVNSISFNVFGVFIPNSYKVFVLFISVVFPASQVPNSRNSVVNNISVLVSIFCLDIPFIATNERSELTRVTVALETYSPLNSIKV